jgi:hypothetical protein
MRTAKIKMRQKTAVLILAVLAAALFSAPAFAGGKTITTELTPEHKQVFSIPVYMNFSPQFTFTSTDEGCADESAGIAFEGSELHASYDRIVENFSKDKLALEGLDLRSRFDITLNGARAALFKIYNGSGKAVVGKWALLIDRKDRCWMISGTYDASSAADSDAVVAMLKTAYWDKDAPNTLRINTVGRIRSGVAHFRYAGTEQGAVIFTKDGNLPTAAEDGATFIVSREADRPVPDEQREKFAEDRLALIEKGVPLEIEVKDPLKIAGLHGFKHIAYAKDEAKTLIYQVTLFDNTGCTTMVGMANGEKEKNIKLFNKLASTYTPPKQ